MPSTSTIFRHLRPKWFNAKRVEALPAANGGISFILKPVAEGVYDYWVYICPIDYPFSAKVAVAALRKRIENDVVPWGQITLDPNSSILIQLLKSFMNEENIPSEYASMVLDIIITNMSVDAALARARNTKVTHEPHN